METYQKTIVTFATIKALATTLILVAAGIGIVQITEYPMYYQVIVAIAIVTWCGVAVLSYYMDLSAKNIAKSWRDLVQTFEIKQIDNIEMIANGWYYGFVVMIVVVGTSVFGLFAPLPAMAILLSAIGYSIVARNECKTMKDRLNYFMTGYLFGCGAVACGGILLMLMDRFGTMPVLGAFTLDVIITGIYVYMDLLQWEYDQKVAAEKEKQRLEELAKKESGA